MNSYTPVTEISIGCPAEIEVTNPIPFDVGDKAMIIQMKGATVNYDDDNTFGSILDIGTVGNFEYARITGINGNTIQLAGPLVHSYDVNSAVQFIRIPEYTDVVVDGMLTCTPWNGEIGGVLALYVESMLTMSADITVDGMGFRGGLANISGPYSCNQMSYVYPFASIHSGRKGEGVADLDVPMMNGRGRSANGGGGGNNTNAGGAGGGNGGSGGRGGNQWIGNCPNVANGGEPGLDLPYDNALGKVFLGGGGGGGHQNDNAGAAGARGGGIILIDCGTLVVAAGAMSATGSDGLAATNDGGGGGGAGGSVLLVFDQIVGEVEIDVSGGTGSTTSYGSVHGPGGGGGGGVVWSNAPLGPDVSTFVAGGAAGIHIQANSTHGAAAGSQGLVLEGLSVPEGIAAGSIDLEVSVVNENCQGDGTGGISVIPIGGVGPYTINWQDPLVGADFSVSGIVSDTYVFMVTDSQGCFAVDSAIVASELPSYNLQLAETICPGGGGFDLFGQTIQEAGTYTGYGTTVAGCDSIISVDIEVVQALFSFQDTITCGPIEWNGTVLDESGVYTFPSQTNDGCDSIASIDVQIHPSIEEVEIDVTVCDAYETEDGGLLSIPGTYTFQYPNQYGCDSLVTLNLVINSSSVTSEEVYVCSSVADTLVLLYQNMNGCDSLHMYIPILYPQDSLPVAAFGIDGDVIMIPEGVMVATNQSMNATSFYWDFGDGSTMISMDDVVYHIYDASGSYTVMLVASNESGCADTAYHVVHVTEELLVYVPNTFSPNGDGINDEFYVVYSNPDLIEWMELEVYDRWGGLIFATNSPYEVWRGDANGSWLPIGVYVWQLRYRSSSDASEKRIKGHVALIR